MRRKNWKRVLALVVAGTVCQFSGCLGWWGQALIAGSGFTLGATITDQLGLASLIPDVSGE